MLNKYTQIYRGEVVPYLKRQGDKEGVIMVRLLDLDIESGKDNSQAAKDGEEVEVTYTSPFYNAGHGGMLAIPPPGSIVLVYKHDRKPPARSKYYYLTTCLEYPDNPVDIGPSQKSLFSKEETKNVYTDQTSVSHVVSLTNELNGGMVVKHIDSEDKIVHNTIVKSEAGKALILDDSPESDLIALKNIHGDGLVITEEGNREYSARTIDLQSQGDIGITSSDGAVNIKVTNGRDINLVNDSQVFPFLNQNVTIPLIMNGNINLRTPLGDINLAVEGSRSLGTIGHTGTINITTPTARIHMGREGELMIYSVGGIKLKSDTSIQLDAPTILTNTTLLSLNSIGAVGIKGTGTVSIDGATVNLNGGANPAIFAPVDPPQIGPIPQVPYITDIELPAQ